MQDIPPSPLIPGPGTIVCQEFERASDSKIQLSDTAKDKREWGLKEFIVLAVGDERTLDNGEKKPMPWKRGDKIMPMFNQVIAFDIKGRKYMAMPQEAVIGKEDETVLTLLRSEDMRKLIVGTGGPHQ
jgi:co-chaperonin GroES (HSP10)